MEMVIIANRQHVRQLKQGTTAWNAWRVKNEHLQPDLSQANLSGVNLREANLREANLREANMSWSYLSWADLYKADLRRAHLRGADLRGANLTSANLTGANLSEATLQEADLSEVTMDWTVIAGVDLRTTKGLTRIKHGGPSPVTLYSIQLPPDGSALHFLRGVGVSDEWIEDYHIHAAHTVHYYSLFISYSNKDELLAHRLHADLQARGVRCWFAPEDMKIGDKIRQRIDEAIYLQDKLLLLLSKDSVTSDWVENEVEAALEKEKQQKREVLFPIRLDDVVMQTAQAWAATLRRTRHIGNFTAWADPQIYQSAFERLLRDLKQESNS